jgi:hypothetical protein
MLHAMSLHAKLSAIFVEHLVQRNIRYQDDLVDQVFNSSEKRLARVLLLMAQFGKEGVSEMSVPRLSHETLAEMVGDGPFAGQLLHEPIQEAWLYPLRPWR